MAQVYWWLRVVSRRIPQGESPLTSCSSFAGADAVVRNSMQSHVARQPLHASDESLGKPVAFLLKCGITVDRSGNPAAEHRAPCSARANPATDSVAPLSSGPGRGAGPARAETDLGGRDEQSVAVLEESAASSAQLAYRPDRGNLPIQLRVERTQARACQPSFTGPRFFTRYQYTQSSCAWKLTRRSRPPCTPGRCPTPGRRDRTWSQSSGDSTFSGQNGHVWH